VPFLRLVNALEDMERGKVSPKATGHTAYALLQTYRKPLLNAEAWWHCGACDTIYDQETEECENCSEQNPRKIAIVDIF
jgi:hypothetical protein